MIIEKVIKNLLMQSNFAKNENRKGNEKLAMLSNFAMKFLRDGLI